MPNPKPAPGQIWRSQGGVEYTLIDLNINSPSYWNVSYIAGSGSNINTIWSEKDIIANSTFVGMNVTSPHLPAKPIPAVGQFCDCILGYFTPTKTPKNSHYPSTCPKCNEPAYLGITPASLDCSNPKCVSKGF